MFKVYKEKEKNNQVTHWDLDYLSKDEILDLYEQKNGRDSQEADSAPATEKNIKNLPQILIAIGLFLLAVGLYVASLI